MVYKVTNGGVKKKRTMTDAQKKAASERLAKAREARGHDGSKSVHPSLLDLELYPEDSPIHWKKVRVWVKEITGELSAKKALRDSKVSSERQQYQTLQVYLGNLKRYLTSGEWHDHRYGRHMEGKMRTVVHAIGYYPSGRPKRTIGHFYKDVGEYTEEMKEVDDRIYGTDHYRKPKGGRNPIHEQEEVLEDGGENGQDLWS